MGKLLATELKQHLTELGLDIAGPYGSTSLHIEEAQAHALPVPEAIAEKCTRDALQFNPHHGAGRDVFDALVRQVNRLDRSYLE